MTKQYPRPFTRAVRWIALFAIAAGAGAVLAQQQPPMPSEVQGQMQGQADPPTRVGTVTVAEGSVVYAPAGETEWTDLPRNRPITRGDRLWTDEGGRAELHFGSAVLHMDGRTFVEVLAIDDNIVQLAVNEGTVNARVRELRAGDEFEITTPQLAMRASQPGEWRIEVEPQRGFTRVAARSGVAVLYGASGNVQQIVAGQQAAFAGRDLAQLANVPPPQDDGFDRWAADRDRAEDQSVTARIIPRDVVGYQELDQNGNWAQDPTYGPVWYPQVASNDWAPYRFGHWESIAPWGWTWVDDAPWGFAPFHYGRWIEIGSRWAWVPGPLGRHPVYAPALVAFVGGGNAGLTVASGPGIGWYPLAPGEVWRPYFDASPVYVRNANRYLVTDSRYYNTGPHFFLRRPEAVTAVRIDDFNRGRPVNQRWARITGAEIGRMQPASPPIALREVVRRDTAHEQRRMQVPPQQQRWTPPAQQQFTQPMQSTQPAPRQQQWREQQSAVQTQRIEAVRQQQAARELQRQQLWQAQRQQVQQAQQQRAVAAQQQHQWQARAQHRQPEQRQVQPQHREETRAAQRQAQHDDRRSRRYE